MKTIGESLELSAKIAKRVQEAGGKAYYVGGCVRDFVMQRDVTDLDIEVYGMDAHSLVELLSEFGNVTTYGKSFGIVSLSSYPMDFALPRKEKPTGTGHRDFEITFDCTMNEKDAASRRDFTINALMQDIITGEILDFFGGREDIEKGIIRHISDEHFCEDPLRVFRGAQFASRFEFETAPKTLELYKKIPLTSLSRERVMEEMKKALLLSQKPSYFFETLKRTEVKNVWFPELFALIGVKQNPAYHAEGDVWNHTMLVLDESAKLKSKTSNPLGFMLCALCHDFGKKTATCVKDGVIHAYNHETLGLPITEKFLKRLTDEKALIKYVLNLTELHMKPRILAKERAKEKSTNRLFDRAVNPMDLIYLSQADGRGKIPLDDDPAAFSFLTERLKTYQNLMAKPHVTGADLIENGISPQKDFGKILAHAHKLRLAGVDKDTALKECLALCKSGKF